MENANIVKGFIELAQIDTISCLESKIVDAVKRKLTDIGCTVTEDDAASRIDGATAGNVFAVLDKKSKKKIVLLIKMKKKGC